MTTDTAIPRPARSTRLPSEGTLALRPLRSRALESVAGLAGSRGVTTTVSTTTSGTVTPEGASPARARRPLARGRSIATSAGVLVLLLATGFALGAPVLRPAPATDARPTAEPTAVAVLSTANVRARPDPAAPVVAILPAGRSPEVIGRLADSSWLLVQTGPAEDDRGWLPANRLPLPDDARNALAAVPPPDGPAPTVAGRPGGLPDLVIASVFLLRDGHIALEIRNDGDGPLAEARIPVLVTRASGETVGVLEVGPTTLPPRGTATVVTPVIVSTTGTYTLQLDRQESIGESSRTNNSATKLLVTGGG